MRNRDDDDFHTPITRDHYGCEIAGGGRYILTEDDLPENKRTRGKFKCSKDEREWFLMHLISKASDRVKKLKAIISSKFPSFVNDPAVDHLQSEIDNLEAKLIKDKAPKSPEVSQEELAKKVHELVSRLKALQQRASECSRFPRWTNFSHWNRQPTLDALAQISPSDADSADLKKISEIEKRLGSDEVELAAWVQRLQLEEQEARERNVMFEVEGDYHLVDEVQGVDFLVIGKDGALRPADYLKQKPHKKEGEKIWDKVETDELALRWIGSGEDRAQKIDVIKGVDGELSPEQIATIRALEKQHRVRKGAFGFDKEGEGSVQEKLEQIKRGFQLAKLLKSLPPELQHLILEKITTINSFLSLEGQNLLKESDVGRFVYQEKHNLPKNDKTIQDLVFRIFKQTPGTPSQRQFNKQSINREPVFLIDAVKIPSGVLEFFKYKYRGEQNITACLREYEEGEKRVEVFPELPETPVPHRGDTQPLAQETTRSAMPSRQREAEKIREVHPLTESQRESLLLKLGTADAYVTFCDLFVDDATRRTQDKKSATRLKGQVEKMQTQIKDLRLNLQDRELTMDFVQMNGQVLGIAKQAQTMAEDISRVAGYAFRFFENWQHAVTSSNASAEARIDELGETFQEDDKRHLQKTVMQKVLQSACELSLQEIDDVIQEILMKNE